MQGSIFSKKDLKMMDLLMIYDDIKSVSLSLMFFHLFTWWFDADTNSPNS